MACVYRAVYNFNSPYNHVLSFSEGECFIPVLAKNVDSKWSFGVDTKGNFGYIPCSYVRAEEMNLKEFLDLIEKILEILHRTTGGNFTRDQRRIVRQLVEKHSKLNEDKHSSLFGYYVASPDSPEEHAIPSTDAQSGASKEPEVDGGCSYKDKEQTSVETSAITNSVSDECSRLQLEKSTHSISDAICTDPAFTSNETVQTKTVATNTQIVETCNESTQVTKANLSVDEAIEEIFNVASFEASFVPLSEECQAAEMVTASTQTNVEKGEAAIETLPSLKHGETVQINVPIWLVPSLVEKVRNHTQLSHQNSKLAVAVMVNCMKETLPNLLSVWNQMDEALKKWEIIQDDEEVVVASEDKKKLQHIFTQLWYCKNDEQQRSWPVHEDEDLIKGLLEDLYSILVDADPRISRDVIQFDDYEVVHLLVTYYQMEPRRSLRLAMLQVFMALCELDLVVVGHLLTSILPMELARDMESITGDILKLKYSAYVLTVIFCTGQRPPNGIYEYINKKFLNFLFDTIENDDEVADHFLAIILAFNQHLQDPDDNVILHVISQRPDARILTEKLMLLINREDDPTHILSHHLETPNSVQKFLVDLFSHSNTVQLFYLNDVKVLLDITVRQLTDLPPGEKNRLWYLRMAHNIISNSSYGEHCHQQEGLQRCFTTVLTQEEVNLQERKMVLDIIREFPSWFILP